MTTNTEVETAFQVAEKALRDANTVEELRQAWKDNLVIGHRALGRMLMGKTAEELVERKFGQG